MSRITKGESNMKYVFSTTNNTRKYVFPTHANELIMDRSEATTSEVFVVVLQPGQAPPRHKHDDTEQVFYIIEGQGRLEIGGGEGQGEAQRFDVTVGDVVRIPPGTWHRIFCTGDTPVRYVAVDCFPGGRPTHEPTWDSHVRVVCQQQGWDYKKITKP
jgi:mannose-6-phosphate isomerase-like protein (cupin superfamily)